jgi:tetratricopeptide (TPR) repeat protein
LLGPPQRERLERIIELADENAWRKEFRNAASLVASDRLVELTAGWKGQPPTAIRLLAVALRRRGHSGEAVSLLREALRMHPRDFSLNLELAQTLGDIFPPRTQERQVAYEAATRLNPDSSVAWAGLGDHLAASGRFKEADRCFDLARKRTTDMATIDLARLGQRVFRGEPASSEELRSLHEKYPSRSDIQAMLGINLLFSTRSRQEGRNHLEAARKLQPKLAGHGDALVHLLEGRPAGYLAGVKRLRATWPNNLTLVQSEALGLVMCGFFEEAEALTRRVLDKGEVPAAVGKTLYALQGWAQQWQGDLSTSELSLRAGLNLGSNSGVSPRTDDMLRLLLIRTLMDRGSFEEAERQMKQVKSQGTTLFKAAVGQLILAFVVSTFAKADVALREMDPKKADRAALAILHEAALARGQYGMAYRRHKEVFARTFGLMEATPSSLWHDELFSLTARINAARAALLSISSAERLEGMIESPKGRVADLRNEARTWLTVELAQLAKQAKSPGSQPKVNAVLGYFQRCPDFAIVRDPARRARLDEKEQEAWGKVWHEVTALRQQVQKALREANP